MNLWIGRSRRRTVAIRTPHALRTKEMYAGDCFRPGQQGQNVKSPHSCHAFNYVNPSAGALADAVERIRIDEEGR